MSTAVKRIFMVSDTHLGCRANSVQWLNIIEDYFFNFFIPLVRREYKQGDVLFHLGDVFDNRQSINLAAQDLGIRVFEELSKIFPEIHIIVGNHDIMKKNSNDISSVDCLKYIPNVTVHKEPKVIEYSGINCMLMPWRRDKYHEADTISAVNKKIDYLFCHTETQGVQTTQSTKHLSDHGNELGLFSRFKRVYSGHIHFRQTKGNVVFVGNPYHMTRSDRGNDKGVYILDLSTGEHQFIVNDMSPTFIKYNITDIFNRRMLDIVSEISGNFVDVYIPSNMLGKCDISKFMDFLDGHAKRLEPRIYDEDNPITLDEDSERSEFNSDLNLINIATDFINGSNYDDSLKEKLIQSIIDLYKQALSSDPIE